MSEALTAWIITDGRPGHLNQIRGLVARLQAKCDLQLAWLDMSKTPFRYTGRQGLLRQFSAPADPLAKRPDWIIGAGSHCHRPMLWTKWLTGGRALVLMRPSWPLWLFDAACIPIHDAPPERPSVLATQGVLNVIEPSSDPRHSDQGLVLLGGVNRHFVWDDAAILEQIVAIADAQSEVQWRVSDSPRTPPAFLTELRRQNRDNIHIMPFGHSGGGWLQQQLAQAGQVWVSRDSVSMVYESITAGAPTGLLGLEKKRDSRVTRSMDQVLASGLASDINGADLHHPLSAAEHALWEADRAADWLLAMSRGAAK